MQNDRTFTIITQNPVMRELLQVMGKLAVSDFSVLLIGETGTGKEVFAEYIHRKSNRWQKQLVKLGLMALPSDLMASELFGYEKGSFTSAINSKKGLFEIANQGSLFLDDIDDVPLDIQTKLLRVLESHELLRVGGLHTIPVDVRLIAASKVDLKKLVDQKLFRADLFYRINVFPVQIPSLRHRSDDIPLLINHFLKKFVPQRNIVLSQEAMDALIRYEWPGNVRELRNIVQRLSLMADDYIDIEHIPSEISGNENNVMISSCGNCFKNDKMPYRDVMNCIENQLFEQALKMACGNQSEAARLLGLSLSTFRDRLRKQIESQKDCSFEMG
jgi:two-component system, NtrC family, response regulator AtoC